MKIFGWSSLTLKGSHNGKKGTVVRVSTNQRPSHSLPREGLSWWEQPDPLIRWEWTFGSSGSMQSVTFCNVLLESLQMQSQLENREPVTLILRTLQPVQYQ